MKKRQRSNSTSNINSSTSQYNILSRSLLHIALKKSKSCSDIPTEYSNSNSNSKSNTNNNSINHQSLFSKKSSCIFPPQRKIVAIGDIHGDLSVAIKALKLGGVISSKIPDNFTDVSQINWEGGNTFIVQLGDQIDRVRPSKLFNSLCTEDDSELVEDEGSDLKIICLFDRLNVQAQRYGGAVLSVLGNHELMNVDGDFRYVSPKEFREFGNYFNGKMIYNSHVPFGYKERKEVLTWWHNSQKMLAHNRYSEVQVGSWPFVHGGISSECAQKYSLDEINYHIKNWLLGDQSHQTQIHVNNSYGF